MKINILLPRRMSGTTKWGLDLSTALTKAGAETRVWRGEKEVLESLFLANGDILHTAVPIPWKKCKKMVFSIHGNYKNENNPYTWAYARAIKIADCLSTPTRTLAKKLNLPPEKTFPIRNGVFLDNNKRQNYAENDKINLLTMTNFDFKEKANGILDLIEIVNKAADATPRKLQLDILGNGTYFEEIKNKAPKNCKAKVNFEGFQKPDSYLEKCSIYLHYSTLDVMPLSIMESMAKGIPVITTEYGAAHELIKDKKDSFIARTKEEFGDNLISLLNKDDLAREIAKNAKEKMAEEFDWQIVAKEWLRLYEKILEEKK